MSQDRATRHAAYLSQHWRSDIRGYRCWCGGWHVGNYIKHKEEG